MLSSALFSLLVLGAAGGRLGASAEGRAKVWLRQHQSPDEAGLSDLKNSDPNSYAIVQALLMKQQAGLMDASNPGGFKHEEHESAADIMRSAPSIEGTSSSMSELAVSAPVTHASYGQGNPWGFKARPSDDDAMSIITGGAPSPSVDEAPQRISEVAVSAPVQRHSYQDSEEEKEERAALNPANNVLSILGGLEPSSSHSPSPSMSEMAIAAPVRHAEYTPPVQRAQYNSGGTMAYNPKKADDDIMAMIGGDAPSANTVEAPQPISEVAISAPVQHAEYTPPVQQAEYQYTPPVQQPTYSAPSSLLSSTSAISAQAPPAEYTPPVQNRVQPEQLHAQLQEMYTPPVQQAESSPTSSLLSSKRSVSDESAVPSAGGLDEFKNSDPNGYAVVADLLKQQQAGLLDPSNPGNFKHHEQESAVDIMRSAPSIEGASTPMSELAVWAPVHHEAPMQPSFRGGNPWGFNAKKADDDALSMITGGSPSSAEEAPLPAPVHHVALNPTNEQVLSILSDAATVHHDAYTPPVQHAAYGRGNPLAFNARKADDDALSIIGGDSAQSNAPVQEARPAVSMMKQNSYLSQINFPGHKQQEESERVEAPQGGNGVQSFSWGEYSDVASGKVQVRPVETQYIQQQDQESVSLEKMDEKYEETKVKGGSLTSWLTPLHEAPVARKPQQQEDESATYDKHDPNDAMAMDNYIDWAHSRNFQ
jgi:hypothetical protein